MEHKKIILHIGFHKSGSTLIQNYFEKHADVFFSRNVLADFIADHHAEILEFEGEVKEQFVFLSDMRLTVNSWGQSELERTHVKFMNEDEIKSIQEKIALKLKERFPGAKILITTRKKEELLPSLYSQYLLNGGRKSYAKFEMDSSFLNSLFDYAYIADLYSGVFGNSNVHQISYDLLKANPEKFMQSICAVNNFPFQADNFHFVNPSLTERSKIKRRLINNFVFCTLFFFPPEMRNSIFKRYVQKTLSNKSKS